ncbi:Crp/Fnr family transcriptional regulator [Pseudothauera rhizosphaerae]|uniref:Crp/Fnr family transcriptional regulator n=1 Tax=Pseudothauera rhizosphaerae TaxID=2565932 RepID=UPI001454BDE4|nr:Crp/Fnr family transcriptional regulator [Pseudothauera rhizosphaerae]
MRKLAAGATLFSADTPSAGVYTVVKGRVRLERITERGKEAVLFVAQPGAPFAEASIFSDVYHCSAVAVTNVSVNFYPKQKLLAEFRDNPVFTLAYARMLGHQLMLARTRLERANMNNAGERIRHFLMLETGPDGYSLERPGALKELAAELSLTPEALYRTLTQMTKAGEIERTTSALHLIGR